MTDSHMVFLPAVDGGELAINLVDLVAITPDDEGSMLHLRYGGEFVTSLKPGEVADELAKLAKWIDQQRAAEVHNRTFVQADGAINSPLRTPDTKR